MSFQDCHLFIITSSEHMQNKSFYIYLYSFMVLKMTQNGQRGNIYKYKHIEHIYGA